MFWLRNKKNNFQLHALIWGPDVDLASQNVGPDMNPDSLTL